MLEEKQIAEIFRRREAHLTGLHVVYASGLHGEEYINKDAILAYTRDTSVLCQELANRVRHLDIDVVVAPVVGAVALSQWVAFHLSNLTSKEVLAVYADKVTEEAILKEDRRILMELADTIVVNTGTERPGELGAAIDEIQEYVAAIRARPKFVETFEIKRGYDRHVKGKRALVVEDVINTGGSISRVIEVTRKTGGLVVGACGLANRGGITANDLDVPELIALLNVKMDAWKEDEMPKWLSDREIATHVGKGGEYLAKKGQTPSA
jgi:orotate phosphoribosyltransferase